MRTKLYQFLSALVIALVLMLAACGTTEKTADELSLMGKLYHNTTAHYNGYFNADEIIVASYVILEGANQDNYTRVLPVFPFEGGDADGVKSELDRAIEKVSIVATIHKPSVWRDDCYLKLGEAQFLKEDFESAEETFEFFVDEFDPLKAAKKKKKSKKRSSKSAKETSKSSKEKQKEREQKIKDRKKSKKKSGKKRKRLTKEEKAIAEAKKKADEEKAKLKEELELERARDKKVADEIDAESYFMKHRPVFKDGILWLARTYVARGKYNVAKAYLRRLKEDKALHDDIREQLHPVEADFYLKQNQDAKAIEALKKAYESADKRQDKARYAFIVGQLLSKNGQESEAGNYFSKVIKHRPAYVMSFNAKLSEAKSHRASGQLSSDAYKKKLLKFTKEEKNAEYEDQVYMALANEEFASNNHKEGIAHLKTALSKGGNNVYKMEAYYQLAQLFYDLEDYVSAKSYYDSTLTNMDAKDPRSITVKRYSQNLSGIAEQITIINLQDSLMMLGKLSDEELTKRALALQEAEEEKKQAEEISALNTGGQIGANKTAPRVSSGIGGGSGLEPRFFAYDKLLLDKGKRDFNRKYGDRVLEDNWRRSKKATSTPILDEEEEETEEVSTDEQLILKYFPDVPRKPGEDGLCLRAKEEALFKLGTLYRDNLENDEKCVSALEQLLTDYPETEFKKDAYFYLYLAYKSLGQSQNEEKYARLLTNEFPESLYAKSISDPDFVAKMLEKKDELADYYQETYDLFNKGDFESAASRIRQTESLFGPNNALQAKFALLDAMCQGNIKGKEEYIDGLQDVIAKHPDTPESTRAREIMRFIKGDKDAFKEAGVADLSKYRQEDDKLHYVIAVIFNLNGKKLSDAKISISDYNSRFHKTERLNLSTLDLDIENSTPVILVRKFKGKEKAMAYYKGVQKKQDKFIEKKIKFEVFAISQRNYREVIKEKSVNDYRAFFNEFYLSEENSN